MHYVWKDGCLFLPSAAAGQLVVVKIEELSNYIVDASYQQRGAAIDRLKDIIKTDSALQSNILEHLSCGMRSKSRADKKVLKWAHRMLE